jgi:predicted  nucleic acid-binding Zn-ribbon protein
VACLPTDELQTMVAVNAQLEDSNTTLRQVLEHLAGNLTRASQHMIHLGRRCEDLEQQLEEERSATDEIVKITWTAAQESDRRKLGLLPAPPQQKTGPRHRRIKQHHLRDASAN